MQQTESGDSTPMANPKIIDNRWGCVTIEELDGEINSYGDCMVFPGGCETWDWTETGTHHNPGVQLADIKFIDMVDVIILTRGMHNKLQVSQGVVNELVGQGKQVYVLQTEAAIKLYLKKIEDGWQRIGILIHTTC